MRRFGHLLMGLGAFVGVVVALAAAGQLSVVGIPWLAKVAIVKLAIVAAITLLASGAFLVRRVNRRETEGERSAHVGSGTRRRA
jgi:hypothetical protein